MEVDSEEELSDNFKDEDFDQKAVDQKTVEVDKEEGSGCCYGWLGLRFLADKVGSLFFEDPIETITAGTVWRDEYNYREIYCQVFRRECKEAQYLINK